jgi:hypothetical protein
VREIHIINIKSAPAKLVDPAIIKATQNGINFIALISLIILNLTKVISFNEISFL